MSAERPRIVFFGGPVVSNWLLKRLVALDVAEVETRLAAAGPDVVLGPPGVGRWSSPLSGTELLEAFDRIGRQTEPVLTEEFEAALRPVRYIPRSGSMDFLPDPKRRWTLIGENKRREPRTKSANKRKNARRKR